MQLLVSVSTGAEAAVAVAGGADLVDAKDPLAGPLGAVTGSTFAEIVTAVAGRRPVTAALGDGARPADVARLAAAFARAGAALVKVGFAGIERREAVADLLRAACEGAANGTSGRGRSTGVIAVAYADYARADALCVDDVLQVAIDTTVDGLLIDTFDKQGPALRERMSDEALQACVMRARGAGLLVALAGRLSIGDLPFLREAGADVAGVRGAACGGNREGRVDAGLVRLLRASCAAGARGQDAARPAPSCSHPTGDVSAVPDCGPGVRY